MQQQSKTKSWRVRLGDLALRITHAHFIAERDGFPRHFNFPLAFMGKGRDRGTIRPHLGDGTRHWAFHAASSAVMRVHGWRWWPDALKLRSADFDRLRRGFTQDVERLVLSRIQDVQEPDLRARVVALAVVDPDALLTAADELGFTRGRIALSPTHADRMVAAMKICTFDEGVVLIDRTQARMKRPRLATAQAFLAPPGAAPPVFTPGDLGCLRGLERVVLLHFRDPDGERHWQQMPRHPFTDDECFELARRHLGARFFRVFATALRVLGLPYDEAAMRRLTG